MTMFNGLPKGSSEVLNQSHIVGKITTDNLNGATGIYEPAKASLQIQADELTPFTIHVEGFSVIFGKNGQKNTITFTPPTDDNTIVMEICHSPIY